MSQGSHSNSRKAYRDLRSPLLDSRKLEVYLALGKLGVATDREVMTALGKTDPNYVRPRITELVSAGIFLEVGNCPDSVTGKTVRKIAIAGTVGLWPQDRPADPAATVQSEMTL